MKTKKFMSLILALVMAFSLAIPAFASSSTPAAIANTDVTDMGKIDTAVTTINTGYQAPVLALTVPKTVSALLNPYEVAVKLNENTAIEEEVSDQVASAYNMIISRSSVPLTIRAKATGTIAGPTDKLMTLAKVSTIPAQGATASVKKEAYVWMQFGAVDTSAITTVAGVTSFMQNTPSTTAASQPFYGIDADDITWATAPGTYTDANTEVEGIIIAAGEGKEHLLDSAYQLPQVTFETTGNDAGKPKTVSAVAFRLNGDMVANPKDSPWGKEDKLTVSVAWKFVPGSQTGASASSGITANYDASSHADITFTTTAPADADGTVPAYTVTGVTGLTGVTASNCTWNGTTVTIPASELAGATELGTDGTVNITVAVSYSDGTNTKTDSFAVAVTVTGN